MSSLKFENYNTIRKTIALKFILLKYKYPNDRVAVTKSFTIFQSRMEDTKTFQDQRKKCRICDANEIGDE